MFDKGKDELEDGGSGYRRWPIRERPRIPLDIELEGTLYVFFFVSFPSGLSPPIYPICLRLPSRGSRMAKGSGGRDALHWAPRHGTIAVLVSRACIVDSISAYLLRFSFAALHDGYSRCQELCNWSQVGSPLLSDSVGLCSIFLDHVLADGLRVRCLLVDTVGNHSLVATHSIIAIQQLFCARPH